MEECFFETKDSIIDEPLKEAFPGLYRLACVKDATVVDSILFRGEDVHWEVNFIQMDLILYFTYQKFYSDGSGLGYWVHLFFPGIIIFNP